jgi:integrase
MVDPTQTDATPGGEPGESDLQRLVEEYLASRAGSGSGAYAASARSALETWRAWMDRRGYGVAELSDESTGPMVMRRYAQRLRRRARADDGIAAATAQTYYATIRACLAWGVRDGRLERNPAVTENATEELPQATGGRSDQQHWTTEQRDQLLEHVRERTHDLVDEDPRSPESVQAARDRALVSVLYYAAVRSAEVLRSRHDDREGRQGLRWKRVDLDAGRIEIFGKGEQDWTWHPLPGPSRRALAQLRKLQRPATDEWPVFATSHAPSLWRAARDQLPDRDVDDLVEEHGSIHEVLREHAVIPPALTTDGARSRLQSLTEAAGIDVDEGYLQPHGARRGMVGEVFRRDRGEAQDLARHTDMSVTEDAYRHLDVEEQRDRLNALVEEMEE